MQAHSKCFVFFADIRISLCLFIFDCFLSSSIKQNICLAQKGENNAVGFFFTSYLYVYASAGFGKRVKALLCSLKSCILLLFVFAALSNSPQVVRILEPPAPR